MFNNETTSQYPVCIQYVGIERLTAVEAIRASLEELAILH